MEHLEPFRDDELSVTISELLVATADSSDPLLDDSVTESVCRRVVEGRVPELAADLGALPAEPRHRRAAARLEAGADGYLPVANVAEGVDAGARALSGRPSRNATGRATALSNLARSA
jgi:hypothetical protein